MNNREVSAQEAVYRILSMPMQRQNRTVIFVNADPNSERVGFLKPSKDLENRDDDDEDMFQKDTIVCLATFACNYNVQTMTNPMILMLHRFWQMMMIQK